MNTKSLVTDYKSLLTTNRPSTIRNSLTGYYLGTTPRWFSGASAGDYNSLTVSSVVLELSPVVLYLRHVVRPGDVIIIEEPEAHLHPEMQVEFTRQLAAAVRAGVRVIATTHSEWILEELANLARISELSEAECKDISGGIALEPHEVGAWLFQPKERPNGSVVQEIPLDVESGTFAAGYDDVAAALHNRWADIESRLKARQRR